MSIIDKTGQPRSDEDIKDAIRAIETTLVKGLNSCSPQLFILLPTIREALIELLLRRKGAV